MIRAKWDREQTPRTWMNFTREFNAKFLPPLVQEKREEDFIKCKQGLLSVAEYEALFTKLSRFAPELVATEQRRIRRFVQGLDLEIQESLAAVQVNSFSDIIEKAQRIEGAKAQVKAFNARKRNTPSSDWETVNVSAPVSKIRRGIGGTNTSGTTRETVATETFSREAPSRSGQASNVSQVSQTSTPRMHCNYCGRSTHFEEMCRKKAGQCFKCGSSEHQIAACPKLREEGITQQVNRPDISQANAVGSRLSVPARVYTISQPEVPNPTKVLEGTIPIFHRLANICQIGLPYDLEGNISTRDQS